MTLQPAQTPIDEILAAQRAATDREGIAPEPVRPNRIDRLIALLLNNADDLTAALDANFGYRPAVASLGALGLKVTSEARSLGVVGIIGPWNYPIALVVQAAATAFAAGNQVINMSEVTPAASAVFERCAPNYFDREELAAITGDATVGAEFARQRFDPV